jgi:hypothetical protein
MRLSSLYTFVSKNYDESKIELLNNKFNTYKNEWFNSCANVDSWKDVTKFTNTFKYKCEASSCVCFNIKILNVICNIWIACVSIYFNTCKMQLVNNSFNIIKVNGSIHIHMLKAKNMWKKLLIHSNVNMGSCMCL